MVDPRMSHVIEQADSVLRRASRTFEPGVRVRREGHVEAVGDGVVRVRGLRDVATEELIEIGGRARALVLGIDPGLVHAVLLDSSHLVEEGQRVRSLGRAATIPAGEGSLGRVVDPLGRPLDGRPLSGPTTPMPLERTAPAIHERDHVRRPLFTGILAVDSMFPIGRGQRELILGDEGTGKTAIAMDAMLRQRSSGVVCVYVAVGRRRSETWRAVDELSRGGGRWTVVAASEDQSPAMRYLAPYAGCAIAEYFMDRGEDALIVYDDLSAHAVAWRELSLLLRRPPGREAYPGDVFYLHSRLLERAAKLSPEHGGGSLTALPIAAQESGRISAYIPTNLISITDGQLVLSSTLFTGGQRPAIDAGLSVSRVGGKAQPEIMRSLAGRLRLDYASFLNLEVFSKLGTRLDPAAERRLATGRRIRQLLRAPRGQPLSLFAQVVRLLLANDGELLLRIPEAEVGKLAATLERHLRARFGTEAEQLERHGTLSHETREALVRETEQLAAELLPQSEGDGAPRL